MRRTWMGVWCVALLAGLALYFGFVLSPPRGPATTMDPHGSAAGPARSVDVQPDRAGGDAGNSAGGDVLVPSDSGDDVGHAPPQAPAEGSESPRENAPAVAEATLSASHREFITRSREYSSTRFHADAVRLLDAMQTAVAEGNALDASNARLQYEGQRALYRATRPGDPLTTALDSRYESLRADYEKLMADFRREADRLLGR